MLMLISTREAVPGVILNYFFFSSKLYGDSCVISRVKFTFLFNPVEICLCVILFNLFNSIGAARVKNVCATFRAFCEAKNQEG